MASCRRLVASSRFDAAMLGVILLNAVVLGMETYEQLDEDLGGALETANHVILGIFVAELVIRLVASGPDLREFSRSRWNLFDAFVILATFLPGLRENAQLLRLLRLARLVRVVRFLPDLQVIFQAVARSIPGVASLAVLTALLVYLYGMVGWVVFDDHDPQNFGNVGQAMVTMFVLLTLENLPTYIESGQALSDWTILFYLSYVLVASFLVFNLFIGIVLNSMEEARAVNRAAAAAKTEDPIDDQTVIVESRIKDLRDALDDLERTIQNRR